MLRQGSERWRAYVELSADYLEAMRGIPTLRTFGAAERRRDLLETRSTGVYRATMRPLRTSLLENGITVGFTLFGTFGAVFLATLAAIRAQLPGQYLSDDPNRTEDPNSRTSLTPRPGCVLRYLIPETRSKPKTGNIAAHY